MEGSSSSGMGGGSNPEAFQSLIQCPICFDVSCPILQCGNGHIVCKPCWEALVMKTCPTCRTTMSSPIRNLALEQVINNLDQEISCRFAPYGCTEKKVYSEKVEHQRVCKFRTYLCPLAANGCKWDGRIPDIIQHLKGRKRCAHSVPVLQGERCSFYFSVEPVDGTQVSVQIQSYDDTFFLVAFRSTATTVYRMEGEPQEEVLVEYAVLVQCIGMKEEAEQYAYRLELEKDNTRLSYETIPIPITVDINDVMNSADCLSFNHRVVSLYKTESGMIPIDVTINKL